MFNKKSKMKYCIMAIIIVLCFCLSSCQPTPQQENVVSKNSGVMEEKISNTMPQSFDNELPDRLELEEMTANNGKVVVKINADIEKSGDKYPVYSVSPIKSIPEEQLTRCMKAYFGDAKPYEVSPLTQSELIEIIADCKQDIHLIESESSNVSDELKKRMIENINKKIAEYELLLPNAPLSAEHEPLNLQIEQGVVIGQVDISSSPEPTWVGVSAESERVVMRFSNNEVGFDPNIQALTKPKFKAPLPHLVHTTQEQANEQAIDLLERMSLAESFVPYLTEIVQKSTKDNMQTEDIYAYCVSFTRLINGSVPVGEPIYWDNSKDKGDSDYILPPEREKLNVYVDDTGVVQFDYAMTYEMSDVLNDNVEIISCEAMKEWIPKHLINTFGWSMQPDDPSFKLIKNELRVDKIKLEYLIIHKKDDEEWLLVPAWNVYGDMHSISQIKEEDGSWRDYDSDKDELWLAHQSEAHQSPVMSINAIDGSIM
ncbi:MAG: DUF6034 family protein [Christensenellaceae bacterium]